MLADICNLLAQWVQGVQLNPDFLVELALVLDPKAAAAAAAGSVAVPAVAAPSPAGEATALGEYGTRQANALATATAAWEVLQAQLQ